MGVLSATSNRRVRHGRFCHESRDENPPAFTIPASHSKLKKDPQVWNLKFDDQPATPRGRV